MDGPQNSQTTAAGGTENTQLPTSSQAAERNTITVESLSRKRRASPYIVSQETNGSAISSDSISGSSLSCGDEESAKKARLLAEATGVAGAVNHVPAISHRATLDPSTLTLQAGTRGIVVLPGNPQGLRHQYILGSGSGLHGTNGLLCGQQPALGAQGLPSIHQAPSASTVLQLQAAQQSAAQVLPVANPQPQVAVSMTSAATTNFFTNTAGAPVSHQVINSAGKPVNMTYHTQKDTTFTKIFVGGLPYHTTDASLRKYFEQFGEIEEAVVITDRLTSCSKGYGFVTMADKTAAERACKDPNPVIDGRKANVNLAYIGAKPRGVQTAPAGAIVRQGTYAQYVQPLQQTVQQSPFGVSALYYNPSTAAYVTPGGVLVPGHPSFMQPTPLIDYGGAQYASQLAAASPFAQDVAASVGAVTQYPAVSAAVQAPQQLAHPGYATTYQAAAIPGASLPPGYAAVSSLQPPLATTPNPAYAHLTAQLQAGERLGLANQ